MDIARTEQVDINIKKRIHEILDVPVLNDKLSRNFDIFMMSLIVLNIVVLILQTFKPIYTKAEPVFQLFEIISVIIFSIEYLLRIWSCTLFEGFSHPVFGRIKFCFKPFMVIDLLAVLPFYLPLMGADLRFLRIFRLFRLFRILKLARYSQALRLFGRVIARKKEELIISLSFILLLLIMSAFLMYYAENKAQPSVFSNIFDAMWWAIITFTTVGYGDIYPKTELGKFIASFTTIIGIMLFALPTSILTAGFIEEHQDNKTEKIE